MTRYYISDPTAPKGFVELTYSEWLALHGSDAAAPYASKVYRGEITLSDVPEDIREEVEAVVAAKVARWGLYSERELTDREALKILTGGASE
mgnify:CR=1